MFNVKLPSLDNSIFTTMLEVRIYDINYGNHLGHDSLISLLHEARMRFLKSVGFAEINTNGIGILITNLVVNYLSEAFYGDKLIINIGIGDISKTTMELIYQAIHQETKKEIGRALTSMTFYDYHKAKVAKIPQELLIRIQN